MSTQVINVSNVLSSQLLHLTRYNRRISAQERLGNKAVKLLVAKPETRWWMSYLPHFTRHSCYA